MADLTTYDAVLKEFYLKGPIQKALNLANVLFSRIERDSQSILGEYAVIPVMVAATQAVGARSERATLPTAQEATYVRTQTPLRYNYARIRISGPALALTKGNEGAFVRVADSEIKSAVESLRKDINRQIFGWGTGQLCLANGAGANTTTLTVDTPGNKFLKKNMYIDIYTAAGAREVDSIQITAVTGTTTATLASAQTWSDNAIVYREDARNVEMMGLRGIIESSLVTTLYNVSRDTYPEFAGNLLDNAGTNRALSLALLDQAFDKSGEEVGLEPTLIISNHALKRKYAALVTAQKRFVNTMKLDGGYTAVEFNDKPWVADTDAPPNRIFFCHEPVIVLYRASDFDWMDEDGAILSRVSGVDAYEATLFHYAELGCQNPKAQTELADITE